MRNGASEIFPGVSEKNSKQVVASKILNSSRLMFFESISSATLGFILFFIVSVSPFSIISLHPLHEAQDADLGVLSAYVQMVTLVVWYTGRVVYSFVMS